MPSYAPSKSTKTTKTTRPRMVKPLPLNPSWPTRMANCEALIHYLLTNRNLSVDQAQSLGRALSQAKLSRSLKTNLSYQQAMKIISKELLHTFGCTRPKDGD